MAVATVVHKHSSSLHGVHRQRNVGPTRDTNSTFKPANLANLSMKASLTVAVSLNFTMTSLSHFFLSDSDSRPPPKRWQCFFFVGLQTQTFEKQDGFHPLIASKNRDDEGRHLLHVLLRNGIRPLKNKHVFFLWRQGSGTPTTFSNPLTFSDVIFDLYPVKDKGVSSMFATRLA